MNHVLASHSASASSRPTDVVQGRPGCPCGGGGEEAPLKGGAGEVSDRRSGRRRYWQCRLDVRDDETSPISIYRL